MSCGFLSNKQVGISSKVTKTIVVELKLIPIKKTKEFLIKKYPL
jgi:hypothetical protein